MQTELTKQDINDLQYFWQEKQDLERFVDFERLKPLIQEKKPELIKAWNNYKASVKILDLVIENLDDE